MFVKVTLIIVVGGPLVLFNRGEGFISLERSLRKFPQAASPVRSAGARNYDLLAEWAIRLTSLS